MNRKLGNSGNTKDDGYSRRDFIHTIGSLTGTLPLLACTQGSPDRKPNIVVFFIDDLGYADIEPFGSKKNLTPNLNQMAAEGMKLTSFYVAAPLCSPSRAALLTGCYPRRVGLEKGSWFVVLVPGDDIGISSTEVTLPEVLKSAGYATGCIGKWHLGDQPQFLPTRHGFEYYYGTPYSNDMWPAFERWSFPPLPLLRNEEVVGEIKDMSDQARLTADFTEEAVGFIERNQENPFFLYIPHAMVHWPHASSERFAERSEGDPYKAAVEEIDWSVGRIMQTLKELQLDDHTLVIFTSDNGGGGPADNAPLRGRKGSTWEGGMRVPTIARWPGQIPAGTVCDEIATTMDFLPTFAGLAGVEIPDDRTIDGKDMYDLLVGTPGSSSKYDAFYYKLDAVRSGAWKYFGDGRLFNLEKDIGEEENVAEQYPEVTARLNELLEEGRRDLTTNCRPAGKIEGPTRFLIPRPGRSGPEAHSPVRPVEAKTKTSRRSS